jgi:hypothetical protein
MNNEQKVAVTEDDILEYVLNALYTNLDKNELHLDNDILVPTKLELTDKQIEHIRELIMATNFVRSSVGFGKSGYIYLSGFGIQSLKTYGSYRNYVAATQGFQQEPTANFKSSENPRHTSNNSDVNKSIDDDMAH